MEVSNTTNILNAGFTRNTTASDLLNTDTFGIGNALRISPLNTSRNTALNSTIEQDNNPNPRINAFGIGSANQPEVELSPQARILQQNDANQRALAEGLQEIRDNARKEREEREARAERQGTDDLQTPESDSAALNTSASLGSPSVLQTPSGLQTISLETPASSETNTAQIETPTISLQAQRATSLYTSVQNFTQP